MSQQINLYQPIFRREEKKFSTVAMLQAVGIVAIGVIAIYGYSWWQNGELKKELKRVEQNQASASKRLAEVTDKFGQGGKQSPLDIEVARLESEIVSRQRIQAALQSGVFSNTLGFSDYFISFARQHIHGIWLTGVDITGAAEQMILSGRSTSPELIPRYMQKLSAEKPLAGIVFNVFQMNRPAPDAKQMEPPYIEFQVKTSANPG
ncbi:MAG: hypothetical protein WD823_03810 [Sulfuricaulis sp.]|uniref:hypothetical protein n=1 Tax=Sulfuricaulis sp. TaxID=2003553 RepID=UPI0034A58327